MPLQPGDVLLDHFRIERLVGKGMFGHVYQAWDTSLDRRVAIKELESDLAYDPGAFERFVREAEAVSEIRHPNIVDGHGLEATDQGYYIIMEYLEGRSLADMLEERGALETEEAVRIALQVTDALAVIHAHGIIHRDIKPSNILFKDDGTVKLGDFGTAHIQAAGEQALTMAGTVIGTVNHMSPEQARGERADARSDLYATGALLYEMLSGQPYLKFGRNLVRNLQLIEKVPPLPLPPSVPRPLANVVMRALVKSPQARFQNAAEMHWALLQCLEGRQLSHDVDRRERMPRAQMLFLLVAGLVLFICFLIPGAVLLGYWMAR